MWQLAFNFRILNPQMKQISVVLKKLLKTIKPLTTICLYIYIFIYLCLYSYLSVLYGSLELLHTWQSGYQW